MQTLQKALWYAGVVAVVFAALLAITAVTTRGRDSDPQTAIAMAIVAFVLVRASESRR
jgi:hypothetical protein